MIFTIPNIISMVRIAAVPWFLWLLLGADDPAFAILLLGLGYGSLSVAPGCLHIEFMIDPQFSGLSYILSPQQTVRVMSCYHTPRCNVSSARVFACASVPAECTR